MLAYTSYYTLSSLKPRHLLFILVSQTQIIPDYVVSKHKDLLPLVVDCVGMSGFN